MTFLKSAILSVFVLLANVSYAEGTTELSLQVEAAPIKSHADLEQWLGMDAASNPLFKLSPKSRERLLNRSRFGEDGQITSLYTYDIARELRPIEAYSLLALFGAQDLAKEANNGTILSKADRLVLDMKVSPMSGPWIYNAYCNGGYCTGGTRGACNLGSCKPPRHGQP